MTSAISRVFLAFVPFSSFEELPLGELAFETASETNVNEFVVSGVVPKPESKMA